MASLDGYLLKSASFTEDLRSTIVHRLWGHPPQTLFNGEHSTVLDLGPYFRYYHRQCAHAMHDGGRSISIKDHKELLAIADFLKEQLERDEIRIRITQPLNPEDFNDDKPLDGSINLAARILLMIHVGKLRYAISGRKELQWKEGFLSSFLGDLFSPTRILGHDNIKLEENFNARNLHRIAGLEICLTDNLADHLRLSNNNSRMEVFHHVSFLEYQRNRYVNSIGRTQYEQQSTILVSNTLRSSLFPEGLINETLQTVALLFPEPEAITKTWTKRHLELFNNPDIDPRLFRCGHLRTDDRQIENFTFWHDRLVMLKQVYDEAQPQTVLQWWHDRRNGVQWYTFWVAVIVLVLTVFFGLVQSIEGALQVYKAYHP